MKVNIIDNDLLSIQEARILAENAYEAQQKLATFPQEKLDEIFDPWDFLTRKDVVFERLQGLEF